MATLTGAGHTGRLGAFAQGAANRGCMTIILGGGDRTRWRMVAPHRGRQALLPTNPYCIGIPGGARGPVVLDFSTGMGAGGWIYAAREAGVALPSGMIIDKHGRPSVNPKDYFEDGAILPKGGHIGSGLALIAEVMGHAMLGPVTKGEINWMVLAVDCTAQAEPEAMRAAAEEILAEVRACPPLRKGEPVEVPGERERDRAASVTEALSLPAPIWDRIVTLRASVERQG
jgi:LDH2 family malate/lactate/ureidoglycolate dehydrogenase